MPVAPPSAHLWTLPGGLRLAFERRRSPGFAFDLRLPVGSAHDPVGLEGAGGVLEEWLFKGAGGRGARALQDAFDDLGVRRGGGVGPEATRLSVSGLQADLGAALALCADVLMRPELPEAELPVLTDLARQDLESLADSPADQLAVRAREVTFPRPAASPFAGYAHPVSGTVGGLLALTPGALRMHLERYGQAGAVLGVVADLPPEGVLALVQATLGKLRTGHADAVPVAFAHGARAHVPNEDAEQTHLSLLAPGVPPQSPDWLSWQLALNALSGGSASRLFHAVREERGLAYAVSAGPVVLGAEGFLSVYAGSTPARAAETLAVVHEELARLSQGLTPAEFERARAGLATSLVFGAESLRGRAHALTRDVALFGGVRAVAGLRAAVQALTLAQVNAFLADYHPIQGAAVVTLGPGTPLSLELTHA
ncbi:M16 family metallopeptidase [Deinococcus arcticus]|uniref:Insulinase family protein n=1 Tax=Deinococcus arcticus TaxID=2136176 RepID=A0A2T3W9T9_9DEIO|nr:pitrilysin family protein [Deinococcus arcticus]PTA68680.1 insulinase family protein [Deinococcus arcticus]